MSSQDSYFIEVYFSKMDAEPKKYNLNKVGDTMALDGVPDFLRRTMMKGYVSEQFRDILGKGRYIERLVYCKKDGKKKNKLYDFSYTKEENFNFNK